MDHLQLAASLLSRPSFDVVAWVDPVCDAVSRPTPTRRSSSSARCSGRRRRSMLHRLARYAVGRTDDVGAERVRRDVRAVDERRHRLAAKAIARLARFGFATIGSSALAVRTHVPPLPQRWLASLPEYLRDRPDPRGMSAEHRRAVHTRCRPAPPGLPPESVDVPMSRPAAQPGPALRPAYRHAAGQVPGADTGPPPDRRHGRASAGGGDRAGRRSTPPGPLRRRSLPATAGGSRSTSTGDTTLTPADRRPAAAGRPRSQRALGRLAPPRPTAQGAMPMTDTIEHVHRHPPRPARPAPSQRPPRRSGTSSDLTRSIRDRGVETPLVVLPADGAGIHHIVAGHRRRAAAEAAGLTIGAVHRSRVRRRGRRGAGDARREHPALRRPQHRGRGPGARRRDRPTRRHGVGPQARGGRRPQRRDGSAPASACSRSPTPPSTPSTPGRSPSTSPPRSPPSGRPRRPDRATRRRPPATDGLADRVRPPLSCMTDQAVDDATRSPRRRRASPSCRGRLAARTSDRGRRWTTSASTPTRTEASRATPSSSRPLRRHGGRDPGLHRAAPPPRPQARQRARRRAGDEPTPTEPPAASDRQDAAGGHRGPHGVGQRAARAAEPFAASEAFPLAVRDVDRQRALRRRRSRPPSCSGSSAPGDGYVDHAAAAASSTWPTIRSGWPPSPSHWSPPPPRNAPASRSRSPTVARYLDAIERLGYQPTDWEHTQRLTAA